MPPLDSSVSASSLRERSRSAAEVRYSATEARTHMQTASIPYSHKSFLDRALPLLRADSRILGVAAAGSYADGKMDEFSDLDLVIAMEPSSMATITAERHRIAELGTPVAAFTGEHVGEPRLLICLYDGEGGKSPLHVDLKFVSLSDVATRVDDLAVLWERDGRLSQALQADEARYPMPDLRWIEDRFWVWIHYAALKIGRGELFEAVDFLAFLRAQVLGPLTFVEAGAQPAGVRRVEMAAPSRAAQLQETVAAYNTASCIRCLHAAAERYRSLRRSVGAGHVIANEAAESTAMTYLADVMAR